MLASNSSSALEKNAVENRKLLSQLEEKETKLMEEGARLRKMEGELTARSQKINELESLIAEKESAMLKLKSAVSNALKGFEGKGLTVVNKNGNVYVFYGKTNFCLVLEVGQLELPERKPFRS